jgi:hypothetical protein
MIPKSGNRFSEKIMLRQKDLTMIPMQLDRIMVWLSKSLIRTTITT